MEKLTETIGDRVGVICDELFKGRAFTMSRAMGKSSLSHWLRRGFGMWALNNGAPIEVVSRALGHSSISITENAYAKVLSKTVVSAITKSER